MEFFEIHITGDDGYICSVADQYGLKTIVIDLLRPDGSCLRTECMTSVVTKLADYAACKQYVDDLVDMFTHNGVKIVRVKIECPYYQHYVDQSLYLESHFESGDYKFATSRNQNKTKLLATERTYDKADYEDFCSRHVAVELCLYDTNVGEDADWFSCYKEKDYEHCQQNA